VDLESTVASLMPRLLAYALARTGCRAMAEDVAQDALTVLVRRWRTSGPPESPDAYAFAIARRRAGRAVGAVRCSLRSVCFATPSMPARMPNRPMPAAPSSSRACGTSPIAAARP